MKNLEPKLKFFNVTVFLIFEPRMNRYFIRYMNVLIYSLYKNYM